MRIHGIQYPKWGYRSIVFSQIEHAVRLTNLLPASMVALHAGRVKYGKSFEF
jgi:hypothetical protein